uniref:IgGFc_binding domain-containing protein n=1 Tax=Caenorhabditis tropicalis TaxID=1561998 RepID=A0A1I7UBI0_9PELO
MIISILSFLTILNLVSSQQLIDLNTFTGGNLKNDIIAHAPYDVFVSAQSDDSDLLMQILLVTEDKKNISFFELTNRKPFLTTSQIEPFHVGTTAYVTTNLTGDQMKNLTGVMFISTTKQLQVNNFHVIDVDKVQNLYLPDENQTILFLNSNMDMSRTTTISNFNQTSNSSIFFYQGIPTDDDEKINSFIFSNPVLVQNKSVFIPNVEKFSLNLKAFYVKYYGKVAFGVAPDNYDPNNSTTTAMITTGLVMKPIGQKDKITRIGTMRNDTLDGKVGANLIGSLPPSGHVVVGIPNVESEIMVPTDQIQSHTNNEVGIDFQVSSVNATDGEYFVQYYVIRE